MHHAIRFRMPSGVWPAKIPTTHAISQRTLSRMLMTYRTMYAGMARMPRNPVIQRFWRAGGAI